MTSQLKLKEKIQKYLLDGDFGYLMAIEVAFESFAMYTSHSEIMIKQARENAHKLASDYQNSLPEEDEDAEVDPELSEDFGEHFNRIFGSFHMSNIYYDSMILTIYAFIEAKLFRLCKFYESGQTIKYDDISGKGITKSRTYLAKVCERSFSKIEVEWKTLLQYAEWRNHLTHSQYPRRVHKSKIAMLQFLDNLKDVRVKPEGDEHYVDVSIDSNEIIFNLLRIARIVLDDLLLEPQP